MPAAVEIVEFRFGHGIVHVDRRNKQPPFLMHFVEPMNAGGRLFRNPAPIFHDLVPAIGILTLDFEKQIFDDLLFFVSRFRFRPIAALLELVAFVNEQRRVATVINHQLRTFAVRMRDRPISAPPIIFKRFAFPCENGHA